MFISEIQNICFVILQSCCIHIWLACCTSLLIFLDEILNSITGGSIVGDMAPYQAFAIGGLGSVRGYGEGAVGTGRSCLVANSELTFPLVSIFFYT